MKHYLLICLSLSLSLNAQQTSFKYNDYDWGAAEYSSPAYSDSTDYIFQKIAMVYNYRKFHREMMEERLKHVKVYLNNTEAIDQFNKIYLAETEDNYLANFQARVINDDRVVLITEEQVKKGINDKTGTEYTYFALEGLKVGSIVEYFYVIRKQPSLLGVRLDFQQDVRVEDFSVKIYSPYYLEFIAKVYNYDAEPIYHEDRKENIISLELSDIPALKNEKLAANQANCGRILFKIDKNTSDPDKEAEEIVTYPEVAKLVNAFLHRELSFGEQRAVKKLLEEIKAQSDESATLTQNIDYYLKKNFNLLEVKGSNSSKLDDVIENRAFTYYGSVSLFNHLLREAGVEFELVYTSARNDIILDPAFVAGPFLNDILFFVPDDGALYDCRDELAYNGVIDPLYTGTMGIFIYEMKQTIGYLPIVRIIAIPYQNALYATDSLNLQLSFNPDFSGNTITLKRSLTGYNARYYQSASDRIKDPAELKSLMEAFVNQIDPEATVSESSYENVGMKYLGKKALRGQAQIKDVNLVSPAGHDYLFKIGKLIGPQGNLYNINETRQQAVMNDYARLYYYTISINLPEGFEIENPEIANKKEDLMLEGKKLATFESSLVRVGDSYLLRIREYYTGIGYPAEAYPDFAQVMNTAADFSDIKVVVKQKS